MLPRCQCQWRIHIRCDAARPWRTADQQVQIYQNTSKQSETNHSNWQLNSTDIDWYCIHSYRFTMYVLKVCGMISSDKVFFPWTQAKSKLCLHIATIRNGQPWPVKYKPPPLKMKVTSVPRASQSRALPHGPTLISYPFTQAFFKQIDANAVMQQNKLCCYTAIWVYPVYPRFI